MAPVLVTSGNTVEMVLGTPGGPTIPTTLANMLMATLIHGVEPEPLIRAGRLHHQGWPDTLYHEPGFDRPDLLAALATHEIAGDDEQTVRRG